ncbi:MAG: iron chelate uptake ABC transporter family permease subunit, partial [Phycisphaerales bacterium]
RGRRGLDPATVILVGVVVGILAASMTQLLQQMMPPEQGRSAASAFLGGIRENELGWGELLLTGVLTVGCLAWAAVLGPAMDASSLGDDEAMSVGVGLSKLRAMLFVIAGVLSAGAVVLAGPIGFVGLICPHFVRLASGPRHRGLVVGAALAGAALVVGADTFVRVLPLQTGRLPLSVITAIIGGPVLVHMLRTRNGRMS